MNCHRMIKRPTNFVFMVVTVFSTYEISLHSLILHNKSALVNVL